MTCNNCKQNQMQMDITQTRNLSIDQMQNISIDKIMDLYEQGYRVSNTSNTLNTSNIQSLAIKDIGTAQYIWFGLFVYGSYASYKSKHNIWAIIFAGLSLGTAGAIYTNYKK